MSFYLFLFTFFDRIVNCLLLPLIFLFSDYAHILFSMLYERYILALKRPGGVVTTPIVILSLFSHTSASAICLEFTVAEFYYSAKYL